MLRFLVCLSVLLGRAMTQTGLTGSEEEDQCVLFYEQHCDPSGMCQHCAMCAQRSCVLTSNAKPRLNITTNKDYCESMFGARAYDWHGLCLSNGNSSRGEYCAVRTDCFQFQEGRRKSTFEYNHTCDTVQCTNSRRNQIVSDQSTSISGSRHLGITISVLSMLGTMSDATAVTSAETVTANATTSHGGNGFGRAQYHYLDVARRNPAAFALTATCLFLFIIGMIWVARLWLRSRSQTCESEVSAASGQTFQDSRPPLSLVIDQESHRFRLFPSSRSLLSRTNATEELPTYSDVFQPSPPKYEYIDPNRSGAASTA